MNKKWKYSKLCTKLLIQTMPFEHGCRFVDHHKLYVCLKTLKSSPSSFFQLINRFPERPFWCSIWVI